MDKELREGMIGERTSTAPNLRNSINSVSEIPTRGIHERTIEYSPENSKITTVVLPNNNSNSASGAYSSVSNNPMNFEDEASVLDVASSTEVSKTSLPLSDLRAQLLDYVAKSEKAHFKSQQKDEPELSFDQKRLIAEDILNHSLVQFLYRFGEHLQETHLDYFSGDSKFLSEEAYEINFRLKELRRFYSKTAHKVDIKNRRYEAMKKMISDGSSYFSEEEMRQRNPYLYEQLVGCFLTDEERREREVPDLDNITFVNLLMTQITRDETCKKRMEQERIENEVNEETDDDEMNADNCNDDDNDDKEYQKGRGLWGETSEDVKILMEKKERKKLSKSAANRDNAPDPQEISREEKDHFMYEFVSTMYNSFIDGNDVEFDYSQVDCNPDYDCIDVREKDEEEKYFDSETPEEDEMMDVAKNIEAMRTSPATPTKIKSEDEDDVLDAFMKTVKVPPSTSDLNDSFRNLCKQNKAQAVEKSRVKHIIKFNLKK